MKLEEFNYYLPPGLIAQFPLPERKMSRMLLYSKSSRSIKHTKFASIINYLSPGDVLVLNNTKVIPARLFGQKETGGKIEILIERIIDDKKALAFIRSNKSIKPGAIFFIKDFEVKVLEKEDNFFLLDFDIPTLLIDFIQDFGNIPLPPYIQREAKKADITRYQTVFAQHAGAVAAPTAGLHFDQDVLEQIRAKKVLIEYVTLHVSSGTFMPVRENIIEKHKMHKEHFCISSKTCQVINAAKKRGNKVIAIGTTVVRVLESAVKDTQLEPVTGDTSIFIYPGYHFKIVDKILTNFHLPKSTLLMLVSAFTSIDEVKKIYEEAIREKYRFFSYGDTMFIDS